MVARCRYCDNRNVVTISFRMQGSDGSEGHDVQLRSCHRCGRRHWEASEGTIPLSNVLEMASRSLRRN